MKLNGKEYKVPQINSYKDLVKLEAQGIKIMALSNGEFYDPENLATSIVKGFSYFTGLSFDAALDEVAEHIDNGGGLEAVLSDLTNDIESMKEYASNEGFSKGAKIAPQDHKKAKM
ncbi:hypothetical protein [Anaerosporobacter sp.]|uniref:hypothetical protein n=1 Tax=Anaerosporobacter sp. TaxID=1872529 RepID=UPI00286EC381|nr:hypothetical protein [Anaerosporobacter sp.]